MIRRARAVARLCTPAVKTQICASRCYSEGVSRDVVQKRHKDEPSIKRQSHTPTHTFRYREHGNRPLPLSSFLDPFRLEQRHQHRNRASKPAAPAYEELDDFRKKLACNPFAKLLAQPVRPCTLTEASLPQSLLLNLRLLHDPAPPHTQTLVPLSLHNESVQGKGDGGAAALTKDRGAGRSIRLNKRLLQWLADYYESTGSLKGALKFDGKVPPNIVATVHELLAQIVVASLRWPLERGSKDYVSLPAGIFDLQSLWNGETVPTAVLFFGGRVYSKRMAELEARVDAILHKVDSMIHKSSLSHRAQYGQQAQWTWVLKRADPRVLHPLVGLSTISHSIDGGAGHETSSVPVIPMVDLLGEEGARSLLQGTKHENAEAIAIRASPATADQVARLLSCTLWMKDGYIDHAHVEGGITSL